MNKLSDYVGNTPMLPIKMGGLTVWCKCEFMNPGGSVKDRMATYIINNAEEKWLIKRGDTLIEATSGNTGIAFAMLAAEEQGLQTSFGRCHQEEWNKSVFGTDKKFYMAVAIGYATKSPSESPPDDGGMLTPIVRDGVADGWETKNLGQDYNGPHLRDGRPARDALIKFV